MDHGIRNAEMNSEENLLLTFERFREALSGSDVEALRGMIAEDYRGFDPQGDPQDRKMVLDAYRPGGVTMDRYDVNELETRIIDTVGIITGTGRIQGSYAGHDFSHHVRFLDLYVHRDGRWQLCMSHVSELKAV